MITPPLPIDQTCTAACEEDTAELVASASCFRELVRVTPLANCGESCDQDLHERGSQAKNSSYALHAPPPSPFTLIQQDVECEDEPETITRHEKIAQNLDRVQNRDRNQDLDQSQDQEESPVREYSTGTAQVAAPASPAYFVKGESAPLAPTSNITPLTPESPLQGILECTTQGISHVLAEEITETTLTLDGPRFANTPLAGAKLIVREYSTAPLTFNIRFACVPAGLAYLQPHLKTLSTLFQSRRFPFSIHSVDADLGDGVPSPIDRDASGDDDQHEEARG